MLTFLLNCKPFVSHQDKKLPKLFSWSTTVLLFFADEYVRFTSSDHSGPLPILDKRRPYSLNETYDITQSLSLSNCLVFIFFWEKVTCMTCWTPFIQNRFLFDIGRRILCVSIRSVLLSCFKTVYRFFSDVLSTKDSSLKWSVTFPSGGWGDCSNRLSFGESPRRILR